MITCFVANQKQLCRAIKMPFYQKDCVFCAYEGIRSVLDTLFDSQNDRPRPHLHWKSLRCSFASRNVFWCVAVDSVLPTFVVFDIRADYVFTNEDMVLCNRSLIVVIINRYYYEEEKISWNASFMIVKCFFVMDVWIGTVRVDVKTLLSCHLDSDCVLLVSKVLKSLKNAVIFNANVACTFVTIVATDLKIISMIFTLIWMKNIIEASMILLITWNILKNGRWSKRSWWILQKISSISSSLMNF